MVVKIQYLNKSFKHGNTNIFMNILMTLILTSQILKVIHILPTKTQNSLLFATMSIVPRNISYYVMVNLLELSTKTKKFVYKYYQQMDFG